jgi:hypothetical protein
MLEIRVTTLELKPGGQAGLYPPPKDLAPSASSAATDLVAHLTTVTLVYATTPATASFTLPTMSLPLGQQRPLASWSSIVMAQAPLAVPNLTDTAGVVLLGTKDCQIIQGVVCCIPYDWNWPDMVHAA